MAKENIFVKANLEILWNRSENSIIKNLKQVNQNNGIVYENQINELFKIALLENRPEFVSSLIENGINFKNFQTGHLEGRSTLEVLYNNQVGNHLLKLHYF